MSVAIKMTTAMVLAAAAQGALGALTLTPGAAIDLGSSTANQAPSGIAIDTSTNMAYISMGFLGMKPVNLTTGVAGTAWTQPVWGATPAFSDNTIRPYNGIATVGGQVFVANTSGVGVFNTSGAFQFQLYPFPRTGDAGTGTSGTKPTIQTAGVANSLTVQGGRLYIERYDYQSGASGDFRAMVSYDASSPLSSTSTGTPVAATAGCDTRYNAVSVLPAQGLATNGGQFMDLPNNSVLGTFEWRDSTGADASKLLGAAATEGADALLANGTDGAYALRAAALTTGGPIRMYIEQLSKVGGVWRHTSGTGTTIDQQYGRIYSDAQINLLKGDGTTAITSVRDMEIVGNYLYVSAQGVSVFDLSNPLAPTQVARWDATGTTYDLAVNGGNVYVGVDPASGNHVLQVLSVPEPSVICLGAAAAVLGLLRRRRMR